MKFCRKLFISVFIFGVSFIAYAENKIFTEEELNEKIGYGRVTNTELQILVEKEINKEFGYGEITTEERNSQQQANSALGLGKITNQEAAVQKEKNKAAGKGELTDFQVSTKNIATSLEKVRAYEAEGNWVYALGTYWDLLSKNHTVYVEEAYESYKKLKEEFIAGRPGFSVSSNVQEDWLKIQKQFEKYWCQKCPYIINFGFLEKLETNEENLSSYSLEIYCTENVKYKEMYNTVVKGFRKAYKNEWSSVLNKKWPEVSCVPYSASVYAQERIAVLNLNLEYENDDGEYEIYYSETKPAFIEKWYEVSLDVTDKNNNVLFSIPKNLIPGGKLIIENVDSATAALIDSGNINFVLKTFVLKYGKPESQKNQNPYETKYKVPSTKNWQSSLPGLAYNISTIKCSSNYSPIEEDTSFFALIENVLENKTDDYAENEHKVNKAILKKFTDLTIQKNRIEQAERDRLLALELEEKQRLEAIERAEQARLAAIEEEKLRESYARQEAIRLKEKEEREKQEKIERAEYLKKLPYLQEEGNGTMSSVRLNGGISFGGHGCFDAELRIAGNPYVFSVVQIGCVPLVKKTEDFADCKAMFDMLLGIGANYRMGKVNGFIYAGYGFDVFNSKQEYISERSIYSTMACFLLRFSAGMDIPLLENLSISIQNNFDISCGMGVTNAVCAGLTFTFPEYKSSWGYFIPCLPLLLYGV